MFKSVEKKNCEYINGILKNFYPIKAILFLNINCQLILKATEIIEIQKYTAFEKVSKYDFYMKFSHIFLDQNKSI